MNITLEEAMRMLEEGETWTVATERGEGWIFYFDGKELHDGSRSHVTLEKLLKRKCLDIYVRQECKELKFGVAFIVSGYENGSI